MTRSHGRQALTIVMLSSALVLAAPFAAFANSGAESNADMAAGNDVVLYNNGDTSYNFVLLPKGDRTGATSWRRKDDKTSTYVWVKSCSGKPRMYVDGAKNEYGGSWRDVTVGIHRATKKGEFRIPNLVRENGYSYARLTSWSNKPAEVHGKWSPDSSKSYPVMGE